MNHRIREGEAAIAYDEFGLFHENAEEFGLPWDGPPAVERRWVQVAPGRRLSALVWGTSEPELVLLHGGGQNAHTWDTAALALCRPLVAVDLPGHGHSDDAAESTTLRPRAFADEIAAVIDQLAPEARLVVGMSLGGLTAIAVAARHPHLVRKLAVIDVTPGVDRTKASDIVSFLAGPESFASFEEILERTIRFNPTRSESSLRRGVLHNAVQRGDGRWVWRHQRSSRPVYDTETSLDFGGLWNDLAAVTAPVLLVTGGSSSVVDNADRATFRQHQPDARIEQVDGAGHSIQGDRPVELTRLLARFLDA
jgi:pimeloyl-ACP methyl ester carboxylesterase